MTPKLVILGGNGFIGRHFQAFVSKNHRDLFDIYAVDIHSPAEPIEGVQYICTDLTRKDAIEELLITYQPHYIVNLIGSFSTNNFETLLSLNALISKNLFEATHSKQFTFIERIIIIGSAAAYGIPSKNPVLETCTMEPVNLYGLTKQIQSTIFQYYIRNFGVPATELIIFNIIGKHCPANLSIGSFYEQLNQISDGEAIKVGNLSSERDFLDVEDVCSGIVSTILHGETSESYNLCSGRSIKIRDVLDLMIRASGKKINIEIDPDRFKAGDVSVIFGANEKLIAHTGWKPAITVEESVSKLFQ